jgi:hypothetical protein
MKNIAVCALLLLSGTLSVGAEKERQWLIGRVVSYNTENWTSTGGSNTSGQVDGNGNFNSTTTQSHWNHETFYLTLDGGEYTYFASRTLNWRFQRSPSITENAAIKYVIDGKHLIVLEESEREFKMDLVKRHKN